MDQGPTAYGTWRALGPNGRHAYLAAARARHFARPEDERVRAGVAGAVYTIDGADFDGLDGFLCAIGEAINGPGGYFGTTLTAFDDSLFGGFGLEGPCTIRWLNADRSRDHLDADALVEVTEAALARMPDHPSYDDFRANAQATLACARRGEASLFDTLVDMIESVSSRHLARPEWTIALDLVS